MKNSTGRSNPYSTQEPTIIQQLGFKQITQQSNQFFVRSFDNGLFEFHGNFLPGVQAQDFQYFIALYRDDVLRYGIEPGTVVPINTNGNKGSQSVIGEFARVNYIIGLGTYQGIIETEPEHNPYYSYCSSAVVNFACVSGWDTKAESVVNSVNTSISVRSVSSDTISFDYKTPANNKPLRYKDQVLLFELEPEFELESESKPPYFKSEEKIKQPINNTNAQGMERLSFSTTANTTYCLCYAKGPRRKDICAYVAFKTL